jgi:uncharacterized protein YbjT (DUF2867 family)
MNLVVGATGSLGSEIVKLLADAGKPVRALVRPTSDQKKVDQLQTLGAEIVSGDLKDRPSLDAACRGISAIISTASSTLSRLEGDTIRTVDHEGQLSLVDAARAAGVAHFVLISFSGMNVEFPLQTAKREVERHLKESGMTYTILQPTFFMEVWLSPALGFDAAEGTAQVYGSGQHKISWISFQDVAEFAIASLDNPAARNAVIKLGGPEALSPLEVVKVFEKQSGRPFTVQHVPEEQLRAQKEGATDSLPQSFAGLMLAYAQGNVVDMRATLQKFPVRLRSVGKYASQIV